MHWSLSSTHSVFPGSQQCLPFTVICHLHKDRAVHEDRLRNSTVIPEKKWFLGSLRQTTDSEDTPDGCSPGLLHTGRAWEEQGVT